MVLVLPTTTATSALRVAMWRAGTELYGKLTANGRSGFRLDGVRKRGQSICQYGDARGYRLRRSILVGTMTDAVAARNEEHRNGCNPGHEERIVVGPAYHTAVSNASLVARRG